MNVKEAQKNVWKILSALTQLAATCAIVAKDTVEMDLATAKVFF